MTSPFESWVGHVVAITERHPYWSNAQIAARAGRKMGWGHIAPQHVEAARVYLGAPFPEDAEHNARQWLLWGVATMMGLNARREVACNCEGRRRFADLHVTTRTGRSLVIEVKSGPADRSAVVQVFQYKAGLGAEFAAVSAPSYRTGATKLAGEQGVLLLDGARTVELLGLLASHQVLAPAERRKLEVSAA